MSFSEKGRSYSKRIAVLLVSVAFLMLWGCQKEVYVDPYEGMVSVSDGRGGQMWVPLYEGLPVAAFKAEEFYADGEYINYSGSDYTALRGIDVSEHQGAIDWAAVKNDGVEFAIIRAGYRGYSEGQLFEDKYFRANIDGALAQGIEVGIYFYSQAINTDEAAEEAMYLLSLIEGYDFSLPVFYDWEHVSNVGVTRCDSVDGKTITDCCIAFCEIISKVGYDAGVYFYRGLGYSQYELDRLSHLIFWAAAPGSVPDFYYAHRIWQYSYTAQVSGITGDTDLNLLFVKNTQHADGAAPSIVPGEIPAPEVVSPLT